MDLSKLPPEEKASPEAGAMRLLAIGLLLALLVQPFMFVGGVNYLYTPQGELTNDGIDWIGRAMFLVFFLGMSLSTFSIKKLLHLSDRLGNVFLLSSGATLLGFILIFGDREILLRRADFQIVHHQFGLMGLSFDKLAYLMAALLVFMLFQWLREWAMLRKDEPLSILLRERINLYLIYFAVSIMLFSIGASVTPLYVYLRFPLMLWGIFSIFALVSTIQRVARELDNPSN